MKQRLCLNVLWVFFLSYTWFIVGKVEGAELERQSIDHNVSVNRKAANQRTPKIVLLLPRTPENKTDNFVHRSYELINHNIAAHKVIENIVLRSLDFI